MKAAFEVQGMTCGGCEQSVVSALLQVQGVRGARASHTAGRVDVDASGKIDEDAVRRAIEDAGFDLITARG